MQIINGLTIAEIDELLNASNFLFAQKPFPLKILSENLQKILAKTEWVNGSDLISDLKKITDSKNLAETQKKLTERKTELKAKPVESTVPQKEQLEKLEEEAQKRQTEAKESADTAQKKQEQWLKLQKEKLPKPVSKEEQEKTLEELKGKVVYVIPQKPEPAITLTKEEEAFANLAKQNPPVFEQKLAEDIIKKNPDIFRSERLRPLADIIAADTTKVFIDPSQKPIPTGVFAALTKYKESPEIQKTGALFTLFSEEKQNLYREILNRSVGTNLANKALGFPETVYEFSQTPPEKPEGSFAVKLDGLQANSFACQESPLFQTFDNPLLGEAKTAVSGQLKDFAFSKIASLPKEGFLGSISRFVTSRSFDSVAPFLGLPTQMTYTGTSFFGKMITAFVPQYAPFITNFTAKLGIDIGIKALAPVAATAIEAGVTTAGGIAVKTGLAATLSTTLSALGSWAPVVGNIIGAIVGWLAGKVLEPILNWVKKHQEDLKIVGLIMLGGGAVLRSIPMLVFGGLIFVPIALRSGLSMAGIAARSMWFFGKLGRSMAITIGTPIIVAIIVFPILVAIILFIINSGAYIVPPSATSYLLGQDNPYMSVTKVASPDKISNPSGTQTVIYTVTITALKGVLTNVKILSTSCNVVKKDKSNVSCPAENIPDIPSDLSISPTTPYSFTFSSGFGSGLSNSLVFDSIKIGADTAEEQGISTSGSETVCVGDCPLDCIKVTDKAIPWPGNLRSNVEGAAASLSSEYPGFVAKVCSGGEVNLCYNPPQISLGSFAWHVHTAECDVYFNEKGVGSTGNALFMITHELTHHFQKINGGGTQEYIDSGAYAELGGNGFCSYSSTAGSDIESMAEACGLYASIPSWGSCVSNYKNQYPKNYVFSRNFME